MPKLGVVHKLSWTLSRGALNQLSTTSIKYDHLEVMGTIIGKFHENLLKAVEGTAETKLCLWMDRLMDGRMDDSITII